MNLKVRSKLSMMLAVFLMTAPQVSVLASNVQPPASQSNLAETLDWQYVAFGQSVDLFFNTGGNHPNQKGINNAWMNPSFLQEAMQAGTGEHQRAGFVQNAEQMAEAMQANVPYMYQMGDDFLIESRGGKIANGHDGLTYVYTQLPTDRNYTLRATVTLLHMGNHGDDTETSISQAGAGMMVRDTIGSHRQEPSIEGIEEGVAASNFVAVGSFSNNANKSGFLRDGVQAGNNAVGVNVSFNNVSDTAFEQPIGQPLVYEISRTDEGFFMSVTTVNGQTVVAKQPILDSRYKDRVAPSDLVERINADDMYWGFFASRAARVLVSDITLTDTGVASYISTDIPSNVGKVQPAPSIENHSSVVMGVTGQEDYTLTLLPNADGHMKVHHNSTLIFDDEVSAYNELRKDVTLNAGHNTFRWTYTPSDDNEDIIEGADIITLDVSKATVNASVIWAGVSASGNATGLDATNVMALDDAIAVAEAGQTIYLTSGNYGDLLIQRTGGAIRERDITEERYDNPLHALTARVTDALITIEPAPQTPAGSVQFRSVKIEADYWHLRGVVVGGSGNTDRVPSPVNIGGGNFNIIEQVIAQFASSGAGIQLNGEGDTAPVGSWPRGNYILNSTARYGSQGLGSTYNEVDGVKAQRVGEGNVFSGVIVHNNEDDGFDLFTWVTSGPSAPMLIENSVAYANGSNGFKLGGEGQMNNHLINHPVSFDNVMANFSDNFNPGELLITNATSLDAIDQNFLLRVDAVAGNKNVVTNSASIRTERTLDLTDAQRADGWAKNDAISGQNVNTLLWTDGTYTLGGEPTDITAGDFVSLDRPFFFEHGAPGEGMFKGVSKYLLSHTDDPQTWLQRDAQGNIIFGDFLRPIAGSNADAAGIGAFDAR